jgi:hypothetical protein
MRWTGHAAYMREMRSTFRTSARKLKGSDHLECLGVDERIILNIIITK